MWHFLFYLAPWPWLQASVPYHHLYIYEITIILNLLSILALWPLLMELEWVYKMRFLVLWDSVQLPRAEMLGRHTISRRLQILELGHSWLDIALCHWKNTSRTWNAPSPMLAILNRRKFFQPGSWQLVVATCCECTEPQHRFCCCWIRFPWIRYFTLSSSNITGCSNRSSSEYWDHC